MSLSTPIWASSTTAPPGPDAPGPATAARGQPRRLRSQPRLKDSDSDVRLATAKALGEIGSPGAIEALVLALIDDERMVRHVAGLSLNQIDANWTQSEPAQRACAELEKSLQTRPAWVRASASDVINKLRRKSAGAVSESGVLQFKMAAPDSLGGRGKEIKRWSGDARKIYFLATKTPLSAAVGK